jgi:hypothetical protein
MANAANKIVPMPAFTDPNLPKAAGGSVNFGVANNFPDFEDHPVEHSPDYGYPYLHGPNGEEVTATHDVREGMGGEGDEREGWSKSQWEDLAKEYELPHSGTKDEIRKRVEEHEASLGDEGGDE